MNVSKVIVHAYQRVASAIKAKTHTVLHQVNAQKNVLRPLNKEAWEIGPFKSLKYMATTDLALPTRAALGLQTGKIGLIPNGVDTIDEEHSPVIENGTRYTGVTASGRDEMFYRDVQNPAKYNPKK
ncbi:MAG: hypothetical protein ABIH50_02435 [bacterium]